MNMNKVSDVYGRRIYTLDSQYLGTAKDILIEPETGKIKYLLKEEARSILGRERKDAKKFIKNNFIPFDKIVAISDIIITR